MNTAKQVNYDQVLKDDALEPVDRLIKLLEEHKAAGGTGKDIHKATGISPQIISDIKARRRTLNHAVTKKLARYFNVSPAKINPAIPDEAVMSTEVTSIMTDTQEKVDQLAFAMKAVRDFELEKRGGKPLAKHDDIVIQLYTQILNGSILTTNISKNYLYDHIINLLD